MVMDLLKVLLLLLVPVIAFAEGLEYRKWQDIPIGCTLPNGVDNSDVARVFVWFSKAPYRRDYGITTDNGCDPDKHVRVEHLEEGQWYQWMEIEDINGVHGQKSELVPFVVK
jgi:hypothetical protein